MAFSRNPRYTLEADDAPFDITKFHYDDSVRELKIQITLFNEVLNAVISAPQATIPFYNRFPAHMSTFPFWPELVPTEERSQLTEDGEDQLQRIFKRVSLVFQAEHADISKPVKFVGTALGNKILGRMIQLGYHLMDPAEVEKHSIMVASQREEMAAMFRKVKEEMERRKSVIAQLEDSLTALSTKRDHSCDEQIEIDRAVQKVADQLEESKARWSELFPIIANHLRAEQLNILRQPSDWTMAKHFPVDYRENKVGWDAHTVKTIAALETAIMDGAAQAIIQSRSNGVSFQEQR